MRINLRIEFADGTNRDVTALAPDMVAFEEHFNLSITRLEEEIRLTHMMFLAWHSEFRTKKTGKEFNEWLEDVVSVAPSDADPKSEA